MSSILIFESGITGYGGSFKCCHFIVNTLKKNGYSPYIISNYDSIYWKKLNHNGVVIKKLYEKYFLIKLESIAKKINRRLPYLSIIIDYFLYNNFKGNLKRFILENNIVLVHTNTHFISDFLVYKFAASLKLPIICHLRSMPRRNLIIPEKKMAEYKNSCFIAISKAVLQEWVKAGIPAYKIKLIYDAQSEKNTSSSDKDHCLHGYPTARLLYAGRLKKHKGVDILIEALGILENNNWRLSIVGGGPEMKILKRLARKRGLLKKITFYGSQGSIEKYYKSHDILIVPSLNEEFGLVVIEAMQYGVAVIGSNRGGIPEIIEKGEDGLLFESGNVKSLSMAIKYLIDNPAKRIQIGLKGREKVKHKFTEKHFTKKIIKLYDEMLK